MTSLSDFRQRIDALDEKLVELLGNRLAIVRAFIEQRRAQGTPATQHTHLGEIPDQVMAHAKRSALSSDFVIRLYDMLAREVDEIEEAANGLRSISGTRPDGDGLSERALAIDHAAIAVRDLEGAVAVLCDSLGFKAVEERYVEGSFSGMNSVVLQAGRVKLVLVQGTSEESNVSRYIEHYGPGVQHLAIEVDDAESVLEDLRQRGCDLLTGIIHSPGLDQIFTRRDPSSGMQIEFIARSENDGFSDDNVNELFQAMERENAF
jgi:methylmalonyl-CoA epimerase